MAKDTQNGSRRSRQRRPLTIDVEAAGSVPETARDDAHVEEEARDSVEGMSEDLRPQDLTEDSTDLPPDSAPGADAPAEEGPVEAVAAMDDASQTAESLNTQANDPETGDETATAPSTSPFSAPDAEQENGAREKTPDDAQAVNEETPASSAPVPAAPAPRRSGVGALFAGLFGGVCGAALAVGAGLYGLLPGAGVSDGVQAELTSLRTEIAALQIPAAGTPAGNEETLNALAFEVERLAGELETLRGTGTPVGSDTSALEARLAAVETNLAALSSAVSGGSAGEAPALAELAARLSALEERGATPSQLALPEEDRQVVNSLRAQIETLSERVEALSVSVTDAARAPAPDMPPAPTGLDPESATRIATLESEIAALQGSMSALGDRASAMSVSITDLPQRLADIEARIDSLSTDTEASLHGFEMERAALATDLATLRSDMEARPQDTRGALAAGILALQAASDAGTPFTGAITDLADAGVEAGLLATLEDIAATGAPTYGALRAELTALTPPPPAEEPAGEPQGFLQRLEDSARALVRITPTGGDAPLAPAFTALGEALARADGDAALAALDRLEPETRAAASSLEAGLQHRIALDTALKALTSRLAGTE